MKYLGTLLACSLAFACGDDDDDDVVPADAGADATVGRRLVILATNDEHSHLFGFGPEIDDFPASTEPGDGDIIGSAARRATVFAQERAAAEAAGMDTLTVSSGDQNFGALPQVSFDTTAPDFQIMEALGYDVMCPGNHEFDRGPGTYAAAILAANANGGIPTIVSSNIRFDPDDSGDDALAQLFGEGGSSRLIKRYHVIRTPSGIKVGFVGIMGVGAASLANAKTPVLFSGDADEERDTPVVLGKIYDDIQPVVDTLRNDEGVDVVIALSHSGMRPVPERGEDYNIAENVTGIDVIVSGHTHTNFRKNVPAPDGRDVLVMEGGSFGEYVSRIEIVVPDDGGRAIVDQDATRLIRVDDTIVPDLTSVGTVLDAVIEDLEVARGGATESFLEGALSRIEGSAVTDDPKVLGDLYYREVAKTTFDVVFDYKHTETNILNLSTDALMATAEDVVGPTTFAVQAWGNTRGSILAGQTGSLAFGDLFRVLPLGEDPVDGSAGYPLALVYLNLVEIKAGFDATTADFGLFSGSFYVTVAGGGLEFDTSRDPIDLTNPIDALDPSNGRITQIWIDTDHGDGSWNDRDVAIFDVDRVGAEWVSSSGDATTLYPVVANLLVFERMQAGGLTPKNSAGNPITDLADAYITRPDGSVVKDYEAFMQYIRDESAANGGLLPSRYDENTVEGAIPRRVICTGPACP